MIKRILCVICAIVFVLSSFGALSVFAEVDAQKCSLEITYATKGKGFSGEKIQLHRVAKALDDGSFEMLPEYASYPVSIYDITTNKEWRNAALTLESYVSADNITPYKTKTTQKDGKVTFSNLPKGLYLVCGVIGATNTAEYRFDAFLIYLPLQTQQELNFDVKMQPKSSEILPIQKPIRYKVIKLWKDLGYKDIRPTSVKVDILKDGKVEKTVKLSPENNWSFSFEVDSNVGVWSVVEKNVPKRYTVEISQNQTTFIITNSYEKDPNNDLDGPPDSPSMGDNFPFMFYFVIMLVSGLMLIVLGACMRKGKENE